MAMSDLERQRRQLERERELAKQQLDIVQRIPRRTFQDFLDNDEGVDTAHLGLCYDGMNRLPPDLDNDHDPVSLTGDFEFLKTESGDPVYSGALGRAELEVELLIEAALTLADIISKYKKKMIKERIADLEANAIPKDDQRAVALKEIIDLSKALERLNKTVRHSFPTWEVRG